MSIYDLTEENRAVRERARSFAEEEISPNLAGWEGRDEFPYEIIRRITSSLLSRSSWRTAGCPRGTCSAMRATASAWR